MSNNTFELNGRTYDTLTGAMLGTAPRQQTAHTSVDGMVASKKPSLNLSSSVRRSALQPKHVAAHQPQPTKTLMRRSVKSPANVAAQPVTVVAKQPALHAKQLHAAHSSKLQPKLSSDMINPRRAAAATTASRTPAVQRFSPLGTANQPALMPVPVPVFNKAEAPVAGHPVQNRQTLAGRPHNSFSGPTRRPALTSSQPAGRPAMHPTAVPAPSHPASHRPQQLAATPQAARQAMSEQDLFSQALAQATSHEEPAPKVKTRRSRRRTASKWAFAGVAAALVGLFGFVAFQNRDDIRLQIASAKAGFSAAAPLYKPDGYELADMKYASGSVASLYQQGSQKFSITQKKSNWDSQTLLENFVANTNQEYKGFQANGRTVYVYGEGHATWVNGGIWYQIEATSDLTNEQLVKIAASM